MYKEDGADRLAMQSLRDEFAGRALQAIIVNYAYITKTISSDELEEIAAKDSENVSDRILNLIALNAYALADAMLRMRQK